MISCKLRIVLQTVAWSLGAFFVTYDGIAQAKSSASDLFIIEKVTPNVFLARQKKNVRVDATSTIIVGPTFLTVVEAHSNTASSAVLIAQIKKEISAKPIQYLILTHAHIDHALGASAFRSAGNNANIIAHTWTRDRMKGLGGDASGFAGYVDQQAGALSGTTATEKTKRDNLIAFGSDMRSSVITLPDITLKDSLTIHDGDLKIHVRHLGHGHTPGDLVVHVPSEKLIVTGDLIHDFEPLFWDADPDSWINVLKRIEALPFDHLVGGHGKAQTGKAVVVSWRTYLEELVNVVSKARSAGKSKDDFIKSFSIGSLESLQKSSYGTRIQSSRETLLDPMYASPLETAVKDNLGQVWDFYERQKSVK